MLTLFVIMSLVVGIPEATSNFKWIFWENTGSHLWEYKWLGYRSSAVLDDVARYFISILQKTIYLLSETCKMPKHTAACIVLGIMAVNGLFLIRNLLKVSIKVKPYLKRLIRQVQAYIEHLMVPTTVHE